MEAGCYDFRRIVSVISNDGNTTIFQFWILTTAGRLQSGSAGFLSCRRRKLGGIEFEDGIQNPTPQQICDLRKGFGAVEGGALDIAAHSDGRIAGARQMILHIMKIEALNCNRVAPM